MEKEFNRVNYLKTTRTGPELLASLKQAQLWLIIAAVAAFLASAFFVVKYFVGGDMSPSLWTPEQWLNAAIGLGITAVITAAQAILYQSGFKGLPVVIATIVVVFFGLFSEISQSMERGDVVVRHRSENSAVFRAAVGAINNATTGSVSVDTTALARAQADVAELDARIANKNRCQSCEPRSFAELRNDLAQAQARAASARTVVDTTISAGASAKTATVNSAIAQAKALEYDEDKHYAMIRLIGEFFGLKGLAASFLFSLIIIGTFEYAFHFVGSYVADHKEALKVINVSERVDTPDYAGNTPNSQPPKKPTGVDNAIKILWEAIESGKITAISVRDDGACAQLLKASGIGQTNGVRRAILDTALDALEKEGVLVINPEHEPSNGKPKYLIASTPPLRFVLS